MLQNVMFHEIKKAKNQQFFASDAEDGSRTHKVLLPHGPEPCASANSATSAYLREMGLEPTRHNCH